MLLTRTYSHAIHTAMKLKTYLARERIKQAKFAKTLGVSPGAVWQWINGYTIDPSNVLRVEKATDGKVTRHDLRPDLWPKENTAA